ncbi:ammonium transporter [Breoghania sp. JC706]|uniref:ammonium transporter n=1 Tax=Breoghania sp. JC706 TaxID=3117732 RepID=UPI00300965DB
MHRFRYGRELLRRSANVAATRPVLSLGLAFLVAGTAALSASAQPAPATLDDLTRRLAVLEASTSHLNFVWLLVAAALVLLMQVGFMLLEAGMVRSKNSVNVAQKNMLDFVFSVIMFAAVGFMFAFGAGNGHWIGIDPRFFMLQGLDEWGVGFFAFQVMFCGTAATIVSGAVAERMPLTAYVLCSMLIAGLVYPVFVHWAWGGALMANASAFLGNMGFIDFAGSTVVHSTGAWISLAACIVIGPRIGRFAEDGSPVRIQGHSPVLATAGAFLLFVGWIGFNGGSTAAAVPEIAHIIANTVLAAGTGGAAGYLEGLREDGVIFPEKAFSGMIGGLVAVTAGCMVLTPGGALLVGAMGGLAAVWANRFIERRLGIDDAVGAVGVHGAAGVVGTLAPALIAPLAHLPTGSRLDQLGVQALGVGINFVWAFGAGLIFFHLLGKVTRVRVDEVGERKGLNEAEHGTRFGIGHVEDAYSQLIEGKTDLSLRLPVIPGDEAERLSELFNQLMDSIQNEELARNYATEMKRSEEEAERLSALANSTFEAIVITVEGRIVDGNAALEDLLGRPLEDLKGIVADTLFLPAESEDVPEPSQATGAPREMMAIHARGQRIPVEVRTREIVYRGAHTRVSAVVDLRERKKAEARIRHLAQHDPLTDLPNRAVFTDRLEESLAGLDQRASLTAVLLVDLDRFKDINDMHGHPAGDTVIKVTADRLRKAVRAGDTVARLGGDEFAVIQTDIGFANQAADLAHRLLHILAKPINCGDGLVVRAGASIGVAIAPTDSKTPDTLISRADTALYKAKSMGRGAYCTFEEGMDAAIKVRRELESDLSVAIERDEFELYFQPRMAVVDARIAGYEALIRWHHPSRGLVNPTDFIPVAEHSGQIVPIGKWVLTNACRIARARFGDRHVSVNVSPLQFRDKSFVDTVEEALKVSGLPPERLEIEVTENVVIDDDARALAILKALKRIGVRIALDDFGTGYSALGYLSRFPFDAIKIDRSFIAGLETSDNAMAIVQTILKLGRALGMRLVAEGVETSSQLRLLVNEGCDEVQGYLIGKPAPEGNLSTKAPPIACKTVAACEGPDGVRRLAELGRKMRDGAEHSDDATVNA